MKTGYLRAAGSRGGWRRHEVFHRLGKQDFLAFRLERHRRPIFWQRRKGCLRSGGYRTDKVELCTRHSHGGLHRSGAYQVDGMNEDNKQNEELNEDIAEASGPAQAANQLAVAARDTAETGGRVVSEAVAAGSQIEEQGREE